MYRKKFEELIEKGGTFSTLLLIALAITVDLLSDKISIPGDILILIAIPTLVVTIARHFNWFNIRDVRGITVILYHLIINLVFLFIIPPGSAYVFVGMTVILVTAFYWTRTQSLIALGFNMLAIAGSFFRLDLLPAQFPDLFRTEAMYLILALMIIDTTKLMWNEIATIETEAEERNIEHTRLLGLINSMGDGVIATDEEGRIVTYNGAALEILDTNETVHGKKLIDVMKPYDEHGKLVDIIEDAKRQDKSVHRSDLKLVFGEKDYISLYLNITPIKLGYAESSMRGFTILMRDITKEKSLDDERDEFISVISHELRTPLTIAEGKISNSQLVNDSELKNHKISESLEAAHNQIVFLADMLNDLSKLARAERNDVNLELEDVDPKIVVESLLKTYDIEAKQHGLTLESHIAKQLPYIYTSRMYLDEILQNFVTNAIKYTKKGSITITAGLSGKKSVVFRVKDTGIGISRSDRKRLFEKFFRSEDYRTRETSGTGLGLYVAMKLAQKIQAKLEVDSKLNKGSTFSLTLASLPKHASHRKQ